MCIYILVLTSPLLMWRVDGFPKYFLIWETDLNTITCLYPIPIHFTIITVTGDSKPSQLIFLVLVLCRFFPNDQFCKVTMDVFYLFQIGLVTSVPSGLHSSPLNLLFLFFAGYVILFLSKNEIYILRNPAKLIKNKMLSAVPCETKCDNFTFYDWL